MAPTAAETHAQIEALVNFMRDHVELARGLLRGADGRYRSKRLWENLCNSLNSMGSCTKTVEQWQRMWSDRKHLAKKAAGAGRRPACATGGGPSEAPTLNGITDNFNYGRGFRRAGNPGKSASFSIEGPPVREPAAMSPTHAARPADPLSQEQPSMSTEPLELSQLLSPVLQWTPRGVALATPELPTVRSQLTLNSRRHHAHPRVRRHLAGDSAGSRIVQMEEQRLVLDTRRNEVLGEIKDAVVELCALVREYVARNTYEYQHNCNFVHNVTTFISRAPHFFCHLGVSVLQTQ